MHQMTRAEHVRWCKQRAHEAYAYGKQQPGWSLERAMREACTSMVSDFGKHPETAGLGQLVFIHAQYVTDEAGLFKFIDGFSE